MCFFLDILLGHWSICGATVALNGQTSPHFFTSTNTVSEISSISKPPKSWDWIKLSLFLNYWISLAICHLMEGQHAQMFVSNSGYFCPWTAALSADRAPTAASETRAQERSPWRLSESHSGGFSVTTPPLFFSLKASPKSTFYPNWRRWR